MYSRLWASEVRNQLHDERITAKIRQLAKEGKAIRMAIETRFCFTKFHKVFIVTNSLAPGGIRGFSLF